MDIACRSEKDEKKEKGESSENELNDASFFLQKMFVYILTRGYDFWL